MRRLIVLAGLMLVGCADSAPTTAVRSNGLGASLSRGGGDSERDSDGTGRVAFNPRLLASSEIPPTTSLSTGNARLRIPSTGPIRSRIEIDNRGNEVIRFCHIHWFDRAAAGGERANGPVIWFLTPTGVNMQLVTRTFLIGQDADYVTNSRFGDDNAANEATARAELLRNPADFYVNCHSNAFAGGFIRGDLPGHGNH